MKRPFNIKRELRRVIALEAAALIRTAAAVDASFERAVRLMERCKGKVVLVGVGKSGLIAQKIAATLSSTGTPALFLSPSEALHGSLGVIQARDLVLALGKSGETEELNALLPGLRRIGIPVVALTSRPDSTLGRKADLVLRLPDVEEACPDTSAPTTSTTAALAVGDALAVALMRLRGFGAARFAENHPAGQLGRRLNLTVADVMRSGANNAVVRAGESFRNMLIEVTRKHAGAVSVVDGRGRFLGLVSDYDVRRALERGGDPKILRIVDIMNRRPLTARPEMLAEEAARLMKDRPSPLSVLPVVDARRRAVGLLQVHDLRAYGL
ncbi:MAG: KpsF/GutQ family sugar-phosphate isomerase [Elusimicrobia bacterium]|nr:KpsF/GutQ family sugar-phosphate isomerase [Elusimicrobiota bacterium]